MVSDEDEIVVETTTPEEEVLSDVDRPTAADVIAEEVVAAPTTAKPKRKRKPKAPKESIVVDDGNRQEPEPTPTEQLSPRQKEINRMGAIRRKIQDNPVATTIRRRRGR